MLLYRSCSARAPYVTNRNIVFRLSQLETVFQMCRRHAIYSTPSHTFTYIVECLYTPLYMYIRSALSDCKF